jgi:hypothetical protein
MAGGGNRQEFGDPFNDPKQDNGKPIWHPSFRRKKWFEDKAELTTSPLFLLFGEHR